MKFLVLNAGSGSQRCTLFDLPSSALPEEPREPVCEATLDTGDPDRPAGRIRVMLSAAGKKTEVAQLDETTSPEERTVALLKLLWSGPDAVIDDPGKIDAVGHRVVHGGDKFDSATLIDASVEREIENLSALSPLHNPANLSGYRVAKKLIPNRPHYGVFDTAFHRTLPPHAFTYPGPYAWLDQGIRRYGFHGTSFRWATRRAASLLGHTGPHGLRLVICHLGGGCSLCAVRDGRSVDTTMGFTPLDGIAMCTRSGAVDPGILIYLQRQGASADALEKMLNKESGLKGLSGHAGDTRILRPLAEGGEVRARLALSVFEHRLRAGIAAMCAALGEMPHAIVFTDAMSEEAAAVRAAACDGLRFLGLHLDHAKNSRPFTGDADLSAEKSPVRILLIHSREAWQIACECHASITKPAAPRTKLSHNAGKI